MFHFELLLIACQNMWERVGQYGLGKIAGHVKNVRWFYGCLHELLFFIY